jgi:hypothetical protein
VKTPTPANGSRNNTPHPIASAVLLPVPRTVRPGAVGSLTAAVGFSLFGGVRRAGLWIFTGVTVYGLSTVLFAGYGSNMLDEDAFKFQGLKRTDDALFVKISYLFRL